MATKGLKSRSVKNPDTSAESRRAMPKRRWEEQASSATLPCASEEPPDENRQDRRPALRCRMASQFFFEDHDRRGDRRLVGIYGRIRGPGADRRYQQIGRAPDRPGSAPG